MANSSVSFTLFDVFRLLAPLTKDLDEDLDEDCRDAFLVVVVVSFSAFIFI